MRAMVVTCDPVQESGPSPSGVRRAPVSGEGSAQQGGRYGGGSEDLGPVKRGPAALAGRAPGDDSESAGAIHRVASCRFPIGTITVKEES